MIKNIKKNLKVGTTIYWVDESRRNILDTSTNGVTEGVVTDIKEFEPGYYHVRATCYKLGDIQMTEDGKGYHHNVNVIYTAFNKEFYLNKDKAEKRVNALRKKEANKIKKQILSHQNALSALTEKLISLL